MIYEKKCLINSKNVVLNLNHYIFKSTHEQTSEHRKTFDVYKKLCDK